MKCPKCKSTKIVKMGKVPNLKSGPKQRYRCDKGHTFYKGGK